MFIHVNILTSHKHTVHNDVQNWAKGGAGVHMHSAINGEEVPLMQWKLSLRSERTKYYEESRSANAHMYICFGNRK